ncbi:sensor domain-containing diguanylate cyclase [Vibrio sp. IRLE0018]|uniref:sensor domain-containing diguanylate cyclase n=1 Tax=Vibrio floridensis TaxID=2908007 RepID=UPI001F418677|nr:sensor domain-containing diguanylate cyclase [Vibrio floridensis]MCF8777860.1 sensor domain-containing diguanylate cyclase [Vibrio floridensis]
MNLRVLRLLIIGFLLLAHNPSYALEKESNRLKVANSKAWKPFSYIAEDGKPRGILVDLWQLYGEKNGLEIEFVLLDWADSLKAVEDGRADVHAGMLWSEPREKRFDFADSIMTINTQLYLSQRIITTDLNAFLSGAETRSVGVVEGGYEEHYVETHFPQLSLARFKNNRLMMEAAFREEIDAFVADLQVANFYMYTTARSVAYIPVLFLYSGDIRPAVAEGSSLLTSVNKGFKVVGQKDIERTINSWISIQTVYPKYLLPSIVGAFVLFSVAYIVVLKKTVKSRTYELEVANQNLLSLSQQDYLTKISNRRHFMNQLQQLQPSDSSVSVLVFDIDDFKSINDSYGHAAGDLVIHGVAQGLLDILPQGALYARVGGEEFAVVVCKLNFSEAQSLAEKICQRVAMLVFDDFSAAVTISLGCAYYPELKGSVDLGMADKLMYQAKNSGKNQACAAKIPNKHCQ